MYANLPKLYHPSITILAATSLCVLHLCQAIFEYYLRHAPTGIYKLSVDLYLRTLSVIRDYEISSVYCPIRRAILE